MNMLKIAILFLEQRAELLEFRLRLDNYKNKNPVVLNAKLSELHQIMDALELIDKASEK